VAAYLRDHSEILDLAAQARARADQARAQRDLDFPAAEIVAAGHHLDELRRKQERLRAIAGGPPEDAGQEQPSRCRAGRSGVGTRQSFRREDADPCTVGLVLIDSSWRLSHRFFISFGWNLARRGVCALVAAREAASG